MMAGDVAPLNPDRVGAADDRRRGIAHTDVVLLQAKESPAERAAEAKQNGGRIIDVVA